MWWRSTRGSAESALTHRGALPYFHGAFMANRDSSKPDMGKAILGDIQFWIPLAVLVVGLLLLVSLH